MPDDELDWLAKLYEEQGPTLHRLVVLLGAEEQSGRIVRSALLALHRRGHRLIDPAERVEFLQEHVVHLAHAVRPPAQRLQLPEAEDPRQEEILSALSGMDLRSAEILVVSHYLTVFGPELAGIMRMSVRGCNQRLEAALELLRRRVGDPTPGSVPGIIESLSQEVTAALRSSARTIQAPGTETLSSELLELGQHGRSRVGARTVILSCILSVTLGLGLAAWVRSTSASSPTTNPTADHTATAGASRSIPAQVQQVPLYYVGRADGKLYRELRDLPATGNLLGNGLENLFTLAPLDPDYQSAWNKGHVDGVELQGNVLTVDLSAPAYEPFKTPAEVRIAIDQLVYTASEITGMPGLKVKFLADGAAPPAAFTSAEGFTRDGLAPMPPVWITEPRNGTQFSSRSVVISGSVLPTASVPIVTVTNIDTNQVVASTSAQTSTGKNAEGWRLWTVALTLEEGSYDVRATVSHDKTTGNYSENKLIKVTE